MGSLTTAGTRSSSVTWMCPSQRMIVWGSKTSHVRNANISLKVFKQSLASISVFQLQATKVAPSKQIGDLKDLTGTLQKESWKRQQKSMIWGEEILM